MILVLKIFFSFLLFINFGNSYEMSSIKGFNLYSESSFNLFYKCRGLSIDRIHEKYVHYALETAQNYKLNFIYNMTIFKTTPKQNCLYNHKIYKKSSSSCPYTTKTMSNPNKYPFLIKQVNCDCSNCLGRSTQYSRCEEIKIPVLFLEKTGLCVSCVDQWKPIIDYVGVGCDCIDNGLPGKEREMW
jgi:hypothetical protein